MRDKIHVLLVDDNRFDRELVRNILTGDDSRFHLIEISSREELEDTLQLQRIEVVVTDYNILSFTGLEVTDYIQKVRPDLPVIMLTGTGSELIAVEAMHRGVSDYVVKTSDHIRRLPITITKVLEMKQLETEKLLAQKERLEALEARERIFNAITDPILLLSPSLEIREINKAGAKLVQDPSELLGKSCFEILGGNPHRCPECPLLTAQEFDKILQYEIVHAASKEIYSTSLYLVLNTLGELQEIVLYAKNISETRRLESQLLQSQKLEALGVLSGGIAHDFNNILSIILGSAELAMDQVGAGTQLAEDIEEIRIAGKRAADLVRQILNFSRKVTVTRVKCFPHLIVKEVVKMMKATIPASVEVIANIDPNCGPIMGDPTQLNQIVMNLCTNSWHAIEEDTGTIWVNLTEEELTSDIALPEGAAPGRYVVLSVRDNGTGIEKGVLERIFDPFFTTKPVGKGSGMGLAIVYGIVKSSEGFILVDSTPGEGTVFRVYFPGLEEQDDTDSLTVSSHTIRGGSETILLAEDELLLAKLYRRSLEKQGYRVVACSDSREALQMISAKPDEFDLLLTDQAMPHMSGAELSRRVLEVAPDLPIILQTGYSETLDEEKAHEIGITKYLMKPVDIDELMMSIREVLDASKEDSF